MDLATLACRPSSTARLDLLNLFGGDVRLHWRVKTFGLDVVDPYVLPKGVLLNDSASLFECHGYAGPVEVLVQRLDTNCLRFAAAVPSVESPLTVFSDCLRIVLPVLGLLALAVFFRGPKAAWPTLVFLVVFMLYVQLAPAPKGTQLGDNRFYLPAATELVRQGDLYLDHYTARDSGGASALLRNQTGHFINYYPAGVSILLAPIVAWTRMWNPPEERLAETLAKLVAALGVALFFVICRRLDCSLACSLGMSLVFAFATSQYSIHAGGLASHNLTTTLALAVIALLAGPALTGWRICGLGLLSALGLACRHDFAFVILGSGLTVFMRSRKYFLQYCGWLVLLVMPLLFGARGLYGQWLPPYMHQQGPKNLGRANLDALAGLFFSPNRGLFIYTPVMMLGYVRACLSLFKARYREPLALGLAVTVLAFSLALSAFPMWWGGWSYGPRLFCGIMGPTMVLSAMQIKSFVRSPQSRIIMAVVIILILWGGLVHGKGALVGDGWNATPTSIDAHPERCWDWRDLQVFRDIQLLPNILKERVRHFLFP